MLRLYVTNIVVHNNEPRFYIENNYMEELHEQGNTHSHRCVDMNHDVSRI
jgi:hypothetical protein